MQMYMYRNACWCRGAGLLRLLPPTSVWPPLFLPLAHAHLRAATAGEVDAAEGSSRQGANPPLPLPVNTQQAKERPGPALFSTSNSSPASSIIRSFCATQHLLRSSRYRSATTCYLQQLRAHKTSATHLCPSTFVRTPRSATVVYGSLTVRYGTARVESSPVQSQSSAGRLGQDSIFHLSALTLFPMPFRDRQTFSLHQSLPPRVSSRTPAFGCWLADVDHLPEYCRRSIRSQPFYCLVPGPHLNPSQAYPLSLVPWIPYIQCYMPGWWRRRLDITSTSGLSFLSVSVRDQA